MTTKDLLYLTAVVLTAILAYCHGFFSGFGRARKIYDSLLGRPETLGVGQGGADAPSPVAFPPAKVSPIPHGWQPASSRNRFSGQDLKGDFGNN